MKKIRIGLVGCGRIALKHFEAISSDPRFVLDSCCDTNDSALSQAQKKFPDAKTYSNYHDFLQESKFSLVVIATPTGLHKQMAVAAMEVDKDVVLEKPIALTTKDAKSILSAQERTGKKVFVILQNRLNKTVEVVKKCSGNMGQLHYISGNVFWYRPQSYYNDSWHGTLDMDGGALMNQGTHYVDLLLYFANQSVDQLHAFGGTFAHTMECEDLITINVKFQSGLLGNLQVNTLSFPENMEGSITLFYENATIKIGGTALNEISYWKGKMPTDTQRSLANEVITNIYGNGHVYYYKKMADEYYQKKQSLPSVRDGLASLALIEMAYCSMKLGKSICAKEML